MFTNSDRRVQRVRKAVEPPGEAREDWRILCDLARAAGYAMPHYAGPAEIYAEMASLAPNYAGISHARIDAEGHFVVRPIECGGEVVRVMRGGYALGEVELSPGIERVIVGIRRTD